MQKNAKDKDAIEADKADKEVMEELNKVFMSRNE